MPRPLRLNQERANVVIEAIRNGNYKNTAARLAGVAPPTLHRWLATGADDAEADRNTIYRRLFEGVEEAEAEFEAEMVGQVRAAALDPDPKNWTAAMTLLERTRPHKFGRRDTTVIEGGERPVIIGTANIIASPEHLNAANELLKALTGTKPRELEAGDVIDHEEVDESAAD